MQRRWRPLKKVLFRRIGLIYKMNKYWIFDFDGTLVDSEAAIKKCYIKITNEMAPNRMLFAQNMQIGPTLKDTCSLILGKDLINLLPIYMAKFKYEYDQNTILETQMYPNAKKVLDDLIKKGDKLALATNKRSAPTETLLKKYKLNDYFDWVACIDNYPTQKNKTEMLSTILGENNIFKKAYFVGDTVGDGITANKNNLKFIRASYGYGKSEDWHGVQIFKSINQINQLLEI